MHRCLPDVYCPCSPALQSALLGADFCVAVPGVSKLAGKPSLVRLHNQGLVPKELSAPWGDAFSATGGIPRNTRSTLVYPATSLQKMLSKHIFQSGLQEVITSEYPSIPPVISKGWGSE